MTVEYSPAQEAAFAAFSRATQADMDGRNLGYPNGAVYLGEDMEDADLLLFENLEEDRPVIMVYEDGFEVLFQPVKMSLFRSLYLRMRGRISVDVFLRKDPAGTTGGFPQVKRMPGRTTVSPRGPSPALAPALT